MPVVSIGALQLSWSAPADNGGPAVTGYKVRWATVAAPATYLNSGREDGNDVTGGASARTHTISSLASGTTYQVQVAAVNSNGTGKWSDPQSGVPGAPNAPSAPQNASIAIADMTLTFSWDAPATTGGAAISDYKVRWAASARPQTWLNTPGGEDGESSGVDDMMHTISGLTNGTTYQVQVAAVNSAGRGEWSGPFRGNPATPPGMPGNVSARPVSNRLTLTWTAPADDGGDAISSYTVRWAKGADSEDWVNPPGAPGEMIAANLTEYALPADLEVGSIYEIEIAAHNDAGAGEFSESVRGLIQAVLEVEFGTLTVIEGSPARIPILLRPALPVGVPVAVTSTAGSATSVDFQQSRFEFMTNVGFERTTLPIPTVDDGLVEYDETFSATVSKRDLSAVSHILGDSVTTVVTITDNDRDSAAIAFGTDAAATADHTATASEASGTLNVPLTISHAPAVATTFFIETGGDATEGGSGDYTIAAKYAVFPANANEAARTQNIVITLHDDTLNEADEEIMLRLLAADDPVDDLGDYYTRNAVARISVSSDDRPGEPIFTLQPGNASLIVNWTPPDETGSVTGYRIRWSLADAGSGSPGAWNNNAGIDPGSDSAYTITGLTNGNDYDVQIAALNAHGTGQFSGSMRENPTLPPAAPGNLSVTPGTGLLRLTWTAPADNGGEAVSGYAVRWAEGNDAAPSGDGLALDSLATAYVLRDLKSATTYEVQVAARNAAGLGAWSESEEGVTSDFDLDVNQSGGNADWQDGVLIARYLAGVRGDDLIAGGLNNSRTAQDIEAHINAGELDIDDANGITAADGIMLGRYLMGVTGAALTDGQSNAMPAKVIENIEAL
ncbi:MAG: fibronectin type III domain-containing protein [Gammaproteobacteria bacterium]